MGIYLPNMEMPFCCLVCPCSGANTTDDDNEVWVCEASELRQITTEDGIERRPEWCPLVHVPPHGRLGDLDVLIDKVIAKYLEHERKGELVFAAAEIKQDIVDLISNAPTVIPAESEEIE